MMEMSLQAVADVVGGELHDVRNGSVPTLTGAAFVDSRRVEVGGLFVALAGEQVDGHDYAAGAVRDGAAGVLAARAVGVPAVVVEEPLTALEQLARHGLASLRGTGAPQVVAVTGSQGKTSTKDLLAHVLAQAGPTVATAESMNNEIGLPLTVLRADRTTRYLVLEMGSRGPGHLSSLCRTAPPDVSVVLNVGKAHLGEFGSQEEISRAKGEIVEALPATGTAVLNMDDPLVVVMADRTDAHVLWYGAGMDADVGVRDLVVDDRGRARFGLALDGDVRTVALQVLGGHQATNAAAAAGAARALGLDLDSIAAGLGTATMASRWRLEVHERGDGVTVVNDAYNANPDSMVAALQALTVLGRGARTVAVLGEMCELGPASLAEHATVGRLVTRLGVDRLLVVGEGAREILRGADESPGRRGRATFVSGTEQALAWLEETLLPGDVVLLKASRAVALERVAEALLADRDSAR